MKSSDPLRPTPGKRNFCRITRLLICGCTQVARKNFDILIPPGKLATELKDPTNMGKLRKARMTTPQRDLIYPSAGTPVDSSKFDISVLYLLFRNICPSLTPPSSGWGAKPNPSDVSFEADLERMRLHRNEIYGHVDESMEIDDATFQVLWKDISECLLRMAANVSLTLKTEWKNTISKFKTQPLTPEEEECQEELDKLLKDWYNSDKDVIKGYEELKQKVKDGNEKIEYLAQKVDTLCNSLSEKSKTEGESPLDVMSC